MTILDLLPDRSGLDRIWSILPQARLVGGSVRDLLLGGQDVHDLDLATPEPPEEMQARLEAAGVKTIPTGLSHGTITALIARVPYEITTLRRDITTDGRHAEVAWTTDWQEDAARRDFTINALFCDRHGEIHDYFGGQDDLKAHRLRFVGDAGQRIEEDALRILRFFRFDARFGGEKPDAEALSAITARAGLIAGLSGERLASEMLRILVGPHLMRTLGHMDEAGILAPIVPAPRLDRLARALDNGLPEDGLLRLGVLSDAPDLARKLRLSGKQSERLARMNPANRLTSFDRDGGVMPEAAMFVPELSDDCLRRLLSCHPKESLIDRSWSAQADSGEQGQSGWDILRARLAAMVVPVFPIAGRDAVALGVPAGKDIGVLIGAVTRWWRARGCLPDRDACLRELKNRLPLSPQGLGR
ncbi:CCA tRNA nucleotidyltransferase [Asaia siamensis]|uniref:Poly(A) polymerase n=1 Tax=Asaia siamensis TaxID=110479 RepID=A0ABQ1LT32_9PROT|nr:CCA tRNA nucleotidyltransferase [Asaia siamensis]GBR03362.1 polynucleotide adenylyltransferase [Asaia siamensis NRIC 0323]GGC29350.1 poly(A) polymerase [Asaia siamensis]